MKKFKTFDGTFYFFLIIFLMLLYISVKFLPNLIIKYPQISLDSEKFESIGNSFGNIVGTLVAMVAAFLTFIAFWVQYKANKQQWHSIQIDRLENRIYEMLNLHKQNVSEINLVDNTINKEQKNGREVFPHFFSELEYCYNTLNSFLGNFNIIKDKETSTKIAYIIFFVGLRYEQKDYLKEILGDYFSLDEIENLKDFYYADLEDKKYQDLAIPPEESIGIFSYDYYAGHMSNLGHYYRHLFQTVGYIADYSLDVISKKDKESYLKTIRAQLSNYEQLLLYYNSLTKFGEPWIKKGYLTEYKMIKNIPLPLANFGLTPEEKFKEYIEMLHKKNPPEELFEWHEIIKKGI